MHVWSSILAQAATAPDAAIPWTIATVAGVGVVALVWFQKHTMTVTIPSLLQSQQHEREKFAAVIDAVQRHCDAEMVLVRAEMVAERAAWLADAANDRAAFRAEMAAAREFYAAETKLNRERYHASMNRFQEIVGRESFLQEIDERKRRDGVPSDRGTVG